MVTWQLIKLRIAYAEALTARAGSLGRIVEKVKLRLNVRRARAALRAVCADCERELGGSVYSELGLISRPDSVPLCATHDRFAGTKLGAA